MATETLNLKILQTIEAVQQLIFVYSLMLLKLQNMGLLF